MKPNAVSRQKHPPKAVPVLMHHYISNYPNSIAMPPALFEEQCKAMAENGWRGVGLDEAEAFLVRGEALPPKSCLITFDDGYLDNYVYAAPILEKYGHKGVVFVVAELLEQSNVLRPTLKDVWSGKVVQEQLPGVDKPVCQTKSGYEKREDLFLSWEEARCLDKGGVMQVAAHSLRHEQVFSSDKFSSFKLPAKQMRTFYHTSPASPWGMPIFASIPELSGPAFIPDDEFMQAMYNFAPQDEDEAANFFAHSANIEALQKLVSSFSGRYGRPETAQETKARFRRIMQGSQDILEQELGHKVASFCWPWGKFCTEARQAGIEAGFNVFYTTDYGINKAGSHLEVKRFKAKSKPPAWLMLRLKLYSSPLIGRLYAGMRM